MSPRGWTRLLSVPVLVSLTTFIYVLTSRFRYMTGGYGLTVWWATDRNLIAEIGVLAVFVLHWLTPLVVLSVVKQRLERARTVPTLVVRIAETRELYGYFTVAFFLFLLPLFALWLDNLFLLPVFYLAFPVLAYSNLLRPGRGGGPPFPPAGPSTDPGSSRARTRLSLWMRLAAVGAAFSGAGIWTVLELRAPWWPRGPELGMLEALATVLGVAGFAVLAIMLLVQTAEPTRDPNP